MLYAVCSVLRVVYILVLHAVWWYCMLIQVLPSSFLSSFLRYQGARRSIAPGQPPTTHLIEYVDGRSEWLDLTEKRYTE